MSVEQINYYINRVIPMVFDDSMSMLELMYATQAKINEVIASLEQVDNIANTYTDNAVASTETELREYALGLHDAVHAYAEGLNVETATHVADELATMETTLTGAIEAVDEVRASDTQNKYNYLLSLMNRYSISIINPATGLYTSVQQAINDVFDMLKTNALTATTYDAKQKTATVYDGLQVTAINYDMSGNTYVV